MVSKYFNRVSVSSPTFSGTPDVNVGFQCSISVINEGTGIVEYSFDSINLHGDLVPGTASQEIVFEQTSSNVMWFRLKSGATSAVRVEGSDTQLTIGSAAGGSSSLTGPLPAGTNQIGHVVTDSGSTTVVSNFPGTQPVSGSVSVSGTVTANVAAGTNVIGHVIADTGSTTTVSNFPATQPVSGTVTSNIGTSGSLALDASITSLSAKLGSLGQKAMAGSAPVVIASDQAAVPVSGTVSSSYAYGSVPSSVWLKNVFTSLAATGSAIKSSAGILRFFQILNNTGSTANIQIFDRTTAPTAGAVPIFTMSIASAATAQPTLFEGGLPFSTGIYLVFSSTLATYTAITSTAVTGIVIYA